MRTRFRTALLTIVNIFLASPFCFSANPVAEIAASPEAKIEVSNHSDTLFLPFEASIVLEEISFKNSSADFFTFHVKSDAEEVNLRGLEFFDDKVFKTIEQDFPVRAGQQVYFQFNAAKQKDQDGSRTKDQIARLFSSQKGLTGTSEQLLIRHNGKPLAFFCWFKTPVAAAELKQFPSIVPEELWEETDIENCYPSDSVKNNQSLIKSGDENNASAWEIKINEDDADKNQQDQKTTKNVADASLENLIESGGHAEPQLIPEIIVTEIFPAPSGKNGFEWIELLNQGDETINLENWIIDDSAGGSKPRRLGRLPVEAGQTVQINLKEYKIVLNNNSDVVRLFLPDGSPVIEQEYDSAKKGHSFALILNDDEETWQWTSSPTPGQPNPQLTTMAGVISGPAQFGKIYFFPLQLAENGSEADRSSAQSGEMNSLTDGSKEILVIFTEDLIKGPLAKEIFRTGTSGLFTGELLAAPSNRGNFSHLLRLHSYELGGDATASPPPWPAVQSAAGLLLLAAPALLGGGGYWLWKRKQLSANEKSPKLENVTPIQKTNHGPSLLQIP